MLRHGERLDYTQRDLGNNWTAKSDRPFDPPLTDHGCEQGTLAGGRITELTTSLNIAPVSVAYTSPLIRCGQTITHAKGNLPSVTSPVKIEAGLVESINEDWYVVKC